MTDCVFQTSDIKDDIELLVLTLFDVVMEAVANNKSTIMVRIWLTKAVLFGKFCVTFFFAN